MIGLKGDSQIGIFPIFYQKELFLKVVSSPPLHSAIPFLGPAIVDYDKLKQDKKETNFIEFQRAVEEFMQHNLKPNYTLFFTAPGLLDLRPLKWTGYRVEPFYDYKLDLSVGLDKVWENFGSNLRGHVRDAEGKVTVSEGSETELLYIIESLIERYKEQDKMPTTTSAYILELFKAFYPKNFKVFIARYNNELVGGIIALCYKDTISFWMGSVKPQIQKIQPNDFLHWEAIKWAYNNNFRYYEEVGANTERLCKYKSKFNGVLSTRFSAKKYSSFIYKFGEYCYFKFFKRFYSSLKLKNNFDKLQV